jgi:signal recognition particle receptor subunit beta
MGYTELVIMHEPILRIHPKQRPAQLSLFFDGVVFVADSQVDRMEDNIDSLKSLDANLRDQGYDIRTIPLVIQYNKRDTPNPIPIKVMHEHLNPYNAEEFEAVAVTGQGVFDSLKAVSKGILKALRS